MVVLLLFGDIQPYFVTLLGSLDLVRVALVGVGNDQVRVTLVIVEDLDLGVQIQIKVFYYQLGHSVASHCQEF